MGDSFPAANEVPNASNTPAMAVASRAVSGGLERFERPEGLSVAYVPRMNPFSFY